MPFFDAKIKSEPKPNWLIIQLGSNDVCVIKSKELVELIRLDVLRLLALYSSLKIVWSEILPRRYWHFADDQSAAEKTRKRINMAVKKIMFEQHGYVISHPNIREKERSLFRHDGTHLSDVGNDLYLQNIQAAIELFKSSGKRVFPE